MSFRNKSTQTGAFSFAQNKLECGIIGGPMYVWKNFKLRTNKLNKIILMGINNSNFYMILYL
ncbi:hypothetical protein DN396_24935 [Bacillus sp. BF9-10]|nr:hypothetical protein DN396_24935 [Bacillus sp. BF9-10]